MIKYILIILALTKGLITCMPAVLQAGVVFGGICLHKISKTTGQKLK